MYLSPRLHFGLMHLTVAQMFGRLQPAVNGFFLQYFRTDMPALHARHDAIFALQQERGLHIGFLHPFFIFIHERTEPPLQRYFGHIGFLIGTHTYTGGQRGSGGKSPFSDNKALRAFALTLPPFAALALAKPSLLLFLR